MMYDGCILNLRRGDSPGTYVYRVVKPDGSCVCPKKECTEGVVKVLPRMFAGAKCNFKVLDGLVIIDDDGTDIGSTDEADLTFDENAERGTIFQGSAQDGDSSLEINITKLESGRGKDSDIADLHEENAMTYEELVALQREKLKELNEAVEQETRDAYAVGGEMHIENLMEDGFFFDPKLGCKAFVPGHCEELDHIGVESLYQIPVPTPWQRVRYENAVAQGVPEDELPMSPEQIIGLCNRVTPQEPPTCFAEVRGYTVPVYDSGSRVTVPSKKLLPDNYTAFVKWTGVVKMVEMLDGMVAALLMTPNLKIIFTERPGMTMGVTEDTLCVGLDYLLEHSYQQLAFVLMHEARHLLFEHPTRKGSRNHTLWNLATDLIINKQITDAYDVDHEDKSGGMWLLRGIKNSERDILCSDFRPRPKFAKGGVYNEKISVADDTAERVYLCLEMGTDDFEEAKERLKKSRGGGYPDPNQSVNIGSGKIDAEDVIKNGLDKKKGPKVEPPVGPPIPPIDPNSLTEEEKRAMIEQAKKQILDGDMSTGGEGGGASVNIEMSTSAYLAITLKQYISMLKAGINCKGEKISVKDAAAARKIMAPYMNIFGLRF